MEILHSGACPSFFYMKLLFLHLELFAVISCSTRSKIRLPYTDYLGLDFGLIPKQVTKDFGSTKDDWQAMDGGMRDTKQPKIIQRPGEDSNPRSSTAFQMNVPTELFGSESCFRGSC
jgi:hypothetical protein